MVLSLFNPYLVPNICGWFCLSNPYLVPNICGCFCISNPSRPLNLTELCGVKREFYQLLSIANAWDLDFLEQRWYTDPNYKFWSEYKPKHSPMDHDQHFLIPKPLFFGTRTIKNMQTLHKKKPLPFIAR